VSEDQAIIEQLKQLVKEKTELNAKLGELEPSLNLETSGLDSFDRINLVMEIEEHFGFELSDSESAGIATIGDLINQIKTKTAVS